MMRLGYRMSGMICAAMLAMTVTGCPKEKAADTTTTPGGTPGSAATGAKKHYTIAVIPKGTKHQFWQSVNAGAQAAAKEEGVTADWGGPTNEGSIMDQVNLVENKITGGVDAIVLAATDKAALVKPVKDAMAKNIPVVVIDSGIAEPDAAVAYIATDNVAGGRAAGEALAKAIGEKGKVGLLIFMKGSGSSDDREKGFKEGIAKYPKVKLVMTLEKNDPQQAADGALNMLTANPDIAGIFAANEPNGVGAANALKQKGLGGKVKLVAYDSSDEEIKAIKDGIIQGTVVQDPYQMGYKGIKTALKAIRKETITEKVIDSGFKVVTKDNLDTPEVQKLVNPTGKKQ
jgi:ribose transport system substrate-binding protein